MNYEELVESRKIIGDMTKEELFTYCQGLLDEVWSFEKESESLNKVLAMQVQFAKVLMNNNIKLKSIIKEAREDLHQVVKWCVENKHNEDTIERYLVVDY